MIAIYGQTTIVSSMVIGFGLTDRGGTVCATTYSTIPALFEGNKVDALDYLLALDIGTAIEIIQRDTAGNFVKSRSCLNKPSLWASIHNDWEDV